MTESDEPCGLDFDRRLVSSPDHKEYLKQRRRSIPDGIDPVLLARHVYWQALEDAKVTFGCDALYDQATEWLKDADAIHRIAALNILYDLSVEHVDRLETQLLAAFDLTFRDDSVRVRRAAMQVVREVHGDHARERVVGQLTDPDAEVRREAASQMSHHCDDGDEDDMERVRQAVELLMPMLTDPSDIVRDWVAFTLGTQLPALDTPELRAAFVSVLDDPYNDVRQEAIAGLARLRDERSCVELVDELQDPRAANIYVDAAGRQADKRLVLALEALKESGWSDRHPEPPTPTFLDDAINACLTGRSTLEDDEA